MEKLSEFKLSDMVVRYFIDRERNICGMDIIPFECKNKNKNENRSVRVQSLVQLKLIGDRYSGQYFGGLSMKYSDSTENMKYSHQKVCGDQIKTYLKNQSGTECVHTVKYDEGDSFIKIKTEFINNSDSEKTLEMLSSFSLMNISPFLDAGQTESLILHRAGSRWSGEGRLVSEKLEDLLLEDDWTKYNSNNLRFGQVGSMPVKGYFPFMLTEDTQNNVIWGVQMGCASSWQMEVTRGDDGVNISGGQADREFGHWCKKIGTGESFSGPEVTVSVCRGGVDDITARLLSAQEKALDVPESEESLPVIFNEYCTTWGNPSHKNISEIINAIKGKGIEYFIVDCGWYKSEGVPWHCSMGDYEPSETLFPEGIEKTAELIHNNNMKAGIWFEIENVGEKAKVYDTMTEHMLKRDGIALTTQNRRFWDMNDEVVKAYLKEHIIDFLKEKKFDYIKVDYNETIGIGCDNEDSLGEGLRRNMLGSVEFFRKMKEEIPDLIIENCASGGNRLEPLFMSLSSTASFSDAHECVEIPIIAANLHRLILPRQSQIWCVIRKSDSEKRISYSIAATFLGRMCLSGDVTELSGRQWERIDTGIEFYKAAAGIIKSGKSYIYDRKGKSTRHPEGWQCVKRIGKSGANGTLSVVHTFDKFGGDISVPIENKKIVKVYPNGLDAEIKDNMLVIHGAESFSGMAVISE